MAITLVDVGTTANDGTGDPLRTAFQTVNTALTRLDDTVDVQTGYVLLKDDGGSAGVSVTTAGNAGVGTTNPLYRLHVVSNAGTTAVFTNSGGASGGTPSPTHGEVVIDSADGNMGFQLLGSTTSNQRILFSDTAGVLGQIQYDHTLDAMKLIAGGNTGITIDSAANVGIGTTNPLKPLHVVGQAVFGANIGTVGSTAAVFTATSSYSSGVEIRNYDAAGWARLDLKHDSASDGFLMYQDASGGVFFRNNSGASTLMQWLNGASPLMTLLASGSFGVGTTSPTEALDVNSDAVRLRTSQTPASATATGNAGTICWDSNYIYVCTATNTWKRATLATW